MNTLKVWFKKINGDRVPEGIQGLIDLDFNTRSWLKDTVLDIRVIIIELELDISFV